MRRLTLTILAAFLVIIVAPHGASAETDAQRERERVRQQQAEAALNVDALQGDKAEVERALQTLNDQLRTEEAALASAEREVAEAEAAQERAEAGIRRAEDRLAALEDQLRAQMIEAYTNPQGDSLTSVLDASSATDIVKRQAILDGQTAKDEDLTDEVRAAQNELRAQRRAAAEARDRAEAKRQEVEGRVASVEQARDQQQTFASQVQERIDRETARAIELGQRDAELSAQILREQAQLQARLAMQRYQEQKQREAAAAASQAQSAPSATYDSSGREAAPVAPPGGVTPGGSGSGGISLCNAGGITVNCQIADQVQRMLAAAAADGVSLSGGGYRDPAQQIALREQHCGSSSYAIYEMPSSQCSPPTAKPGSSQHELGLAIDFSNCSRGSDCFRWLSANAGSYGMHNLPSESWHWSVNGR